MNALGSKRGHSRYLHIIHYSNKNLSTDELQLPLTLEPTTIQVVKTSSQHSLKRSPTQWDGNEMDSGKELLFVELNMVVMQVYMYNLIDSGHFPPSSFSFIF